MRTSVGGLFNFSFQMVVLFISFDELQLYKAIVEIYAC